MQKRVVYFLPPSFLLRRFMEWQSSGGGGRSCCGESPLAAAVRESPCCRCRSFTHVSPICVLKKKGKKNSTSALASSRSLCRCADLRRHRQRRRHPNLPHPLNESSGRFIFGSFNWFAALWVAEAGGFLVKGTHESELSPGPAGADISRGWRAGRLEPRPPTQPPQGTGSTPGDHSSSSSSQTPRHSRSISQNSRTC